jgi:carbon monoxide dehydrogenase subunit G
MGGVIGGGSCALFQECKNFGTVICETDEAAGGGTNIGGIIGLSNADLCGMIKDCVNGRQGDATAGQLINRGATTGELRMGGTIAFVQNVAVTIEGCQNYGKITNEFETSEALTVGGIAGRILGKATENSISDCHNYGAVSAKSIAGDKKGGVGGILGVFYADNTSGIAQSVLNLTSCSNNADVTLDGIGAGNCHVGGVAGGIVDGNATGSITGCTNNGTVRNGTTESTATAKWIYTGGIIGQYGFATGKISGCSNTGTVINGVHSNQTGGNIRIGGIAGNADCATFENNTNSGTIKDVSLSYSIDMGGILGRFNCGSASTMTNCNNTGKILSENIFSGETAGYVSLGGIIGRTTKTTLVMKNCANDCTLQNTNTVLKNEIMGGIIGYGANKITVSECSSKAVIINPNASANRCGVFGGTWVTGFTVADCSAGGKYGDTVLNSSNYKTYCFGSGSTFKDTANISFAE